MTEPQRIAALESRLKANAERKMAARVNRLLNDTGVHRGTCDGCGSDAYFLAPVETRDEVSGAPVVIDLCADCRGDGREFDSDLEGKY